MGFNSAFKGLKCPLTLILLTWRIWWVPNNTSRWQMGFNSAFKGLIGGGRSVQSTTGSRGVRISGSNASNAGYIMFWGKVQDYWLPTPLACFLFTSLPVRHRVPSGFNWALPVLLAALYYVACWRRQHVTGSLYVYRTEISHIQGSAITQNYRRK